MIIPRFYIQKKFKKKNRFFEETFLLADTSMKIVLRMIFFSLSNANIDIKIKRLT